LEQRLDFVDSNQFFRYYLNTMSGPVRSGLVRSERTASRSIRTGRRYISVSFSATPSSLPKSGSKSPDLTLYQAKHSTVWEPAGMKRGVLCFSEPLRQELPSRYCTVPSAWCVGSLRLSYCSLAYVARPRAAFSRGCVSTPSRQVQCLCRSRW
jgi:hypothetical protein